MSNHYKGTVKFFKADKGYGFIQPDQGGNDVFVHISALDGQRLNEGQRVTYELGTERGRTAAINVRLAA